MPKEYNTQGFANDPLHSQTLSDGEYYPGSLLGGIDDAIGAFLFGDPDASSSIFGELTGYNAQQREFQQQEYMQDKQNQWNSAVEQMKRAKEAGINPLTAAGGIAGNGISSPVSPEPSAAGAAAGGLNAVSGLMNAVTGGKASIAKAALDKSQAKEIDTLLPEKLNKLRNEASVEFEKIGLTAAERTLAQSAAEYADENALRDIQMKRVRVKQMDQELKNLRLIHEQILEDINLKIAQARNQGNQADYYAQLKLKTQEEFRALKADNDFWDLNGFDRRQNANDTIIATLMANGKDPDEYISKWIDFHKRYQSAIVDAEQAELEKHAYNLEYQRQHGKNAADVVNGSVGGPVSFLNRILNVGAGFLDGVSRDVYSIIGKAIQDRDAKAIRDELTMVLNNAYIQLDKYPDDQNAKEVVDKLQQVLQLHNSELIDWFESNWK